MWRRRRWRQLSQEMAEAAVIANSHAAAAAHAAGQIGIGHFEAAQQQPPFLH